MTGYLKPPTENFGFQDLKWMEGVTKNLRTAEGSISALDTRLTTAEGNITSNDTDIAALDARLDTAELDITAIESGAAYKALDETITGQWDFSNHIGVTADATYDIGDTTNHFRTVHAGKIYNFNGDLKLASWSDTVDIQISNIDRWNFGLNLVPTSNNSGSVGSSTYNLSNLHTRAITANSELAITGGAAIRYYTPSGFGHVFYINNNATWLFDSGNRLRPSTDGTLDIGSLSQAVQTVYCENIQFLNGNANIGASNAVFFWADNNSRLVLTGGVLRPVINRGANLGSSSFAYDTIYSFNALVVTSDERLKTIHKRLDPKEALESVLQLDPFFYNFKSDSEDEGWRVGFSAQDTYNKMAPVVSRKDDDWGLKTQDMIPYLVASIHRLNDRIEHLERLTP